MKAQPTSPSERMCKAQILTSGRTAEVEGEPVIREVLEDQSGALYSPNHIPASTRRMNLFLSAVLIGYGIFGAWVDDIYVPGKRGGGIHFHGVPLWFLLAAMLSASANMISVVIDHYDRRNNEFNYRRFARVTQILGWVLFFCGGALDFFVFRLSTRQ